MEVEVVMLREACILLKLVEVPTVIQLSYKMCTKKVFISFRMVRTVRKTYSGRRFSKRIYKEFLSFYRPV